MWGETASAQITVALRYCLPFLFPASEREIGSNFKSQIGSDYWRIRIEIGILKVRLEGGGGIRIDFGSEVGLDSGRGVGSEFRCGFGSDLQMSLEVISGM